VFYPTPERILCRYQVRAIFEATVLPSTTDQPGTLKREADPFFAHHRGFPPSQYFRKTVTWCLNERRLEAPCFISTTPALVSISGRSIARHFVSGVRTRARACTYRLPACGPMDFMYVSVITVISGTVCSWCRLGTILSRLF